MTLGFLTMVAGALLFVSRRGAPEMIGTVRFALERGLIMTAVVATAIGLVLLEKSLQDAGGHILARVGAISYLFGGILIVAAEAIWVSKGDYINSLIVAYVVMAFLGQAAIGGALTQSTLLPASVGWLIVAWNLGWLIILPLATPRDIYFPVLHHLMPLIIGILLLVKT